ncbi:MAG: hypothetical protein II085_04865, partial [Alphaproteobacteria bacterium]|nr:hypothetical protein [Alphaproteobacteria bacterium]
ESNARANGIKLPEMYTKPYVQYGLGLQRRWGDKFTAYGQAMVRNGGRNGVALTAGFRWALGKDETKDENEKNVKRNEKNKKVSNSKPQPTEKVETQPVKKTVIKTLHPNKNVVRYKQLIGDM